MVLFNYATKELTAKVVYYGPGLCGKTTNLQFIFDTLPSHAKGKMLSLATKTDRTLFFDFLPIDLGTIRGMKTKIQLYTVPGQVFYDTTRKLVLKGADGVVFVADSQAAMSEANVDSFENLITNLKEQNLDIEQMPHVIQFNKRDMKNVLAVKQLDSMLNRFNVPIFEAVATRGEGVFETLKGISKLVLKNLSKKYGLEEDRGEDSSKDAVSSRPKTKVPDLPPQPPPAGAGQPKVLAPLREEAAPESQPEPAPVAEPAAAASAPAKPASRPAPPVEQPMAADEKMEEIEFIEEDSFRGMEEVEKLPDEPDNSYDFDSAPDVEPEPDESLALQEEPPPAKDIDTTLEPIASIDDSEVIELDDVDPLEVEELNDMAEIASMASKEKIKPTPSRTTSELAPIEVPVSINLPSSLEGKPLRLQIDILFED